MGLLTSSFLNCRVMRAELGSRRFEISRQKTELLSDLAVSTEVFEEDNLNENICEIQL